MNITICCVLWILLTNLQGWRYLGDPDPFPLPTRCLLSPPPDTQLTSHRGAGVGWNLKEWTFNFESSVSSRGVYIIYWTHFFDFSPSYHSLHFLCTLKYSHVIPRYHYYWKLSPFLTILICHLSPHPTPPHSAGDSVITWQSSSPLPH